MKKIVITLLFIFPLSGCVPAAAVVVGATAGGAVLYDKRSFKTMRSDQHATNVAQYAMNHDPSIKGHARIIVTVFDQIGLLVGQAESPATSQKAYEIMSQLKGVKRTYNAITIGSPISNLRKTKDTYITSKVRAAFLAKNSLKSNDIKVVTENGVVYLIGAISKKQAALATEVARKLSGVSKVVRVFQYS